MIYATYLPAGVTATALHKDGTLFFVGGAAAGFPVTPGAYQSTVKDSIDSFVGRLDESGSKLLFGTYYAAFDDDRTSGLAVAPDGSVWFPIYNGYSATYRLVRISNDGTRVLTQTTGEGGELELVADRAGILHGMHRSKIGSGDCGLHYLRYNDRGDRLTDLSMPGGSNYAFVGLASDGTPLARVDSSYYKFEQESSRGTYIGCVLTPSRFEYTSIISPGMFLTVFGENLGPAGTKVFINGWDSPVLYASEKQLNVLVPFELATGQPTDIEVEAEGNKSRLLRVARVDSTSIKLFPVVLNQNGSVNSPTNPAANGSIVVLWATGAGQTNPPSVTGEVTPIRGRPLAGSINVSGPMPHTVLYYGAAPLALAGLVQINVRLDANTWRAADGSVGAPSIDVSVLNGPPGGSSDQVVVYVQ